ncbi:NAD(P)-binding protein [Micromonospora sp. SL1-18]|uniref:NAD(P)-binding protein n=1 Tax=Micromonospora sp. SL1-18 TaxID=3399128 RepID=UPI003A4D8AF8
MGRNITRRDFLDGVAVTVGALALGGLGGATAAHAASGRGPRGGEPTPYPPALQGMRGYTSDAMVVPHKLRDGTFWQGAGEPRDTREQYDLVVVGGGISGLAAARFYQQEFGHNARILILDALDDFGGHARRNEYDTTARTLIGYGGSQSLDTPSTFNSPARWMLDDLGIEIERFEKYFDSGFNSRYGLGRALFFDKESWGRDRFVAYQRGMKYADILKNAPMAEEAKADLARMYDAPEDWLPGMTDAQKKDRLADITYGTYLTEHVKAHPDAIRYLQTVSNGNWGYGIDAVGALDAAAEGYPGFDGLDLDMDDPDPRISPTGHKFWYAEDDYIYHFPEGNAGVARALVRKLIPDALPGHTMEQITTSQLRYDRLDRNGSRVRIRLSAPVVRVRHNDHPVRAKQVEVAYVQAGELHSVHAQHVVLACNNQVVPYLTDEISNEQRTALEFAGRLALVYTNVQIRNWTSFSNLKISSIRYPTMYWDSASLDFPVSMGSYRLPADPNEPMVLHLSKAVCQPGLSPRDQGKAGRRQLLATSFQDMERAIRDQLARALEPGGFDPARDIEGITVNRWAHGYAYEYARPWDPFWPDGELPSHTARQPWGRVAIANTDSAPRAYADSAIDMAYRAVRDLAGNPSDEVSRGVDGVLP